MNRYLMSVSSLWGTAPAAGAGHLLHRVPKGHPPRRCGLRCPGRRALRCRRNHRRRSRLWDPGTRRTCAWSASCPTRRSWTMPLARSATPGWASPRNPWPTACRWRLSRSAGTSPKSPEEPRLRVPASGSPAREREVRICEFGCLSPAGQSAGPDGQEVARFRSRHGRAHSPDHSRPRPPPKDPAMTDPRARRVATLASAAKAKSQTKTHAAEQAIRALIKRGEPITFQAVQRAESSTPSSTTTRTTRTHRTPPRHGPPSQGRALATTRPREHPRPRTDRPDHVAEEGASATSPGPARRPRASPRRNLDLRRELTRRGWTGQPQLPTSPG